MTWRYKAHLQFVFSIVPFGDRLNYLCQRRVTRTLPISDAKFVYIVSVASEHIEIVRQYWGHHFEEATFYEFGAGWDLMVPLAFYTFGVERQILVDIHNLLKLDLVNDTIEKFQRMSLDLGLLRKPDQFLNRGRGFLASLKKYYGIEYRAPCDARAVGLDSGSIDCITSTNTLEHIPPQDIQAILLECHRLLRDDGIASFRIDYQDHYAYFDDNISVYNFLKYSDKAWKFFTPTLQYQNRLRHRDFLALFDMVGFDVVHERRAEGEVRDLDTIKRLPPAEQFRAYTLLDLAVRYVTIVLRKRSTDATH